MTITIEGYSVVVKKSCIVDLLEDGTIQPPNRNHIADDHIWRCGFMAESDAQQFVEDLEAAGLNGSQGPDPDVVIVNEFLQEVVPYCEWLELAQWEKAVLAWKTGTDPQTLVALEGFDPKVGSGLNFYDQSTMNDLEFLRVEDNIEVYFNKKLGREVYLGRTTKPVEATFESATATIRAHMRTAGEPALKGEDFQQVSDAVSELGELLSKDPDWWQALFFHGKGMIATGRYEEAFESLSRAYSIEKEVEAIARELGGVCLELGRFEEAVEIGQHAATLQPDNQETIGNLALTYLLAGNLIAARKTIDAALKIAPTDQINKNVERILGEVESGRRPQPKSMADLQKRASKSKAKGSPFWKFWKK